MKKLLLISLLFSLVGVVKAADTQPTLLFNFGKLNIYIPLTSVDASYLWDLKTKRSLIGGETPGMSYDRFTLTGGAVTSLDGQGAPFVRVYYSLIKPSALEFLNTIDGLHLGIFGGYDWQAHDVMYGIAAAKNIF